MEKKILVIGSLNMDMVIPVKELPRKGETILGGKIGRASCRERV